MAGCSRTKKKKNPKTLYVFCPVGRQCLSLVCSRFIACILLMCFCSWSLLLFLSLILCLLFLICVCSFFSSVIFRFLFFSSSLFYFYPDFLLILLVLLALPLIHPPNKKNPNHTPVSGYDQPCDLRLLTPTTCLRVLTDPVISAKSPPNLLVLKKEHDLAPERTSPRKASLAAASAAATTATAAANNNIFMCKQCGNSYARPHSLNRHLRFECGVEPKFECPICRKKSKHKHNLVLHMRTHQHR